MIDTAIAPVTAIIDLLAVAGILFAVACAIFNFVFRNKRLQSSSKVSRSNYCHLLSVQDSLNESTYVELLCNHWLYPAMRHYYSLHTHQQSFCVPGSFQGSAMDTITRILTLLWNHYHEDVSSLLHRQQSPTKQSKPHPMRFS